MKLYPRLFLSHLLVIALMAVAVLAIAELLAPALIRHHADEMARLIGPAGASLRGDLERGVRGTLTAALLAALPLAAVTAAVTALLAARRVVRSVQLLSDSSRTVAAGRYDQRLPEDGRDELADLAHNFNTMAATLAQVEQGRVELISSVAHELRTPLAALRGYAEALGDGVMPPDRASAALTREVAAMERLVRDLSLVSRVEAGAVDLHPTRVPVAELLSDLQERFSGLATSRALQFSVDAPAAFLEVWADAERASQVLSNLVTNALRYTPAGGRVGVSARLRGGQVAFLVEDDGPGIPAELLPRIFERFYRGDPARTRDGGSGVGLTIARGLAEGMGGSLTVQSSVGMGSVFTCTFPAASSRMTAPARASAGGL